MNARQEVFEAAWETMLEQVLCSYNTTTIPGPNTELYEDVLLHAKHSLQALVSDLHVSLVCLGAK